jgi:hypothetical protein
LFFAVYGRALQAPEQFPDFLDHVVTDWPASLCDARAPGTDPEIASRTATLVIATIRGYCSICSPPATATGSRMLPKAS